MRKFAKTTLILLALSCITVSFAQASFEIPNYVYTVSQLRTAQQNAIDSNKSITFVYANKNTDCSLGTAASIDLFNGLKDHSIIVYAERNDWNNLPPIVKSGINSPEAGKYIPITVIVNSNLDSVIRIIPYAKTKQRGELIKQAHSQLSEN
ncbi:MAG: hypothetical protein PHZ02_06050 [Desulfocapsaceae bacterium]|nr:hypothetical protein [Desulfocapsaceae bacterium]